MSIEPINIVNMKAQFPIQSLIRADKPGLIGMVPTTGYNVVLDPPDQSAGKAAALQQ